MATLPAMTLHEYLRQNKIPLREMAAMLGRDASEVSRWATGRRVPPLEIALEIQRATNGAVEPQSFVRDGAA
jgi:transcriptional regulator with XRE-family HTH domain